MKTLHQLFLLPLFCLCNFTILAQDIRITILDADTEQPIPFAGVVVNDEHRGGSANSEGVFTMPYASDIRYFRLRAFGYQSLKVDYDGSSRDLTFELNSTDNVIDEVEIFAGENPLHRIIRNVIANRNDNNPESLDAFRYETYSKFVVTFIRDSVVPDFDTIYMPIDTANPELGVYEDSIIHIDSVGYKNRMAMERGHIFLMESITERQYAAPRDNERVLASRISGLRTPLFVLLSNEMQSFSFYDNYIEILGSQRVNPVAPGAIGRYIYESMDTIINGQDSVYVIRYYPKPGSQFLGLDGEIYITTDGWAVKRVIARPTDQDILDISLGGSDVLGVEIQQFYEKRSDHWFPAELTMDFKRFTKNEVGVSMISATGGPGMDIVGLGRTELRNIEINPPLRPSDVDRINVAVDPLAADRSEEFWLQYRDSLSAKDVRTYEMMDSIGDALDIDRKLNALLALQTGKLRFGYFDYNIDKILRYNVYEGFRLGFGMQTSPKLSKYFSVGGYGAYGFRDKVWKYGYFGEIYIDPISETKLFGGYSFDIQETGGTRFNLRRSTIFGDQDYRFLFTPTFDEVSDAYVGISHRIWPNWRASLSMHRQNRFTQADYFFQYTTPEESIQINGFNLAYARLEMEYAPNDRYMSGPFGLRALETTYPRFRFAYEESFDGMFERSFPFRRVDVQAKHQIRRVYTGTTTITVYGSVIQGDVPYSMLAGPKGNSSGNLNEASFQNSVASLASFETMPFNTYAANRFVAWDIRHSFEDRLFSIGDWAPGIDLLYRGTVGTLDAPELHSGIQLSSFEQMYHEAGLEINGIFSGLGIGFYQRFGAFYTGSYSENAAVKLTYRTTLF